jgi:hypothetical protein
MKEIPRSLKTLRISVKITLSGAASHILFPISIGICSTIQNVKVETPPGKSWTSEEAKQVPLE